MSVYVFSQSVVVFCILLAVSPIHSRWVLPPHDYFDRIVGGSKTQLGDFPHLVAILSMPLYIHHVLCGGNIVNEMHILTAAHCLFNETSGLKKATDIRVQAGDVGIGPFNPSAFRWYYKPNLIFVHPEYDNALQIHDLAVIRVTYPVSFWRAVVQPIIIAPGKMSDQAVATAAGWGVIKFGSRKKILRQRMTYAQLINSSHCRQMYGPYFHWQNNFCAGYLPGGMGPCQGDSGGGLVQDGLLYGIVAFARECGLPLYPNVYTNTTFYLPWIESCYTFNGTQKDIPLPKIKSKRTPSSAFLSVPTLLFILVTLFISNSVLWQTI